MSKITVAVGTLGTQQARDMFAGVQTALEKLHPDVLNHVEVVNISLNMIKVVLSEPGQNDKMECEGSINGYGANSGNLEADTTEATGRLISAAITQKLSRLNNRVDTVTELLGKMSPESRTLPLGSGKDVLTTMELFEKFAITKAMEQCGNNRMHAARLLDISVQMLQRKLKQYDLEKLGEGTEGVMVPP